MIRVRSGLAVAVLLGGVLVWACSSSSAPAPVPASCPGTELVVAASDYGMGGSVVCGAPPCELGPYTTGADLGGDPQLSDSNGRLFFLARNQDFVFELDPACGVPLQAGKTSVKQEGVSVANPQDVAAAADGSLFVVLYNVPRIVVLNAQGKPDGAPIDLSSFDDDGNPEAEAIRIVDVAGVQKAFVTLERLTLDLTTGNYLSLKSSKMLRIDVASRQVEAQVELAGQNPFNTMVEQDGAFYLAEPGSFDAADERRAGIERFDVATFTSRMLVPEHDLGGSVLELAVDGNCGAALLAGPIKDVNPTSLVTFDAVTGQVLTTAAAPVYGPTAGFDLQGLAWRNGSLYVGDRRMAGNGYVVHVFDREPGTCILHDSGRSVALPQKPVAFRAAR